MYWLRAIFIIRERYNVMIGILKFLKGYLMIRVWGFSPERFMNLCSNKNILLWNITKEEDAYSMCISLQGFYQLKEIARKTGTRVVICKRYGLPFLIPAIWARKFFLVGLFLAVSFWMWSTFFIWDIELAGNYQITEDVFVTFLHSQEVTIGMPKEKLDIAALEKEIRKEFPQITWTSAKLSGTKLQIDIKENDAPIMPMETGEKPAANLVAETEGTIVSMIVRKGVPVVAIGDVIEKGTLLVDGKVPVMNEDGTVREYQYVQADADILVEHTRFFQATLPFDYIQKQYTGRTKERFFLRVGEQEWKMPENKPFLLYDSVIATKRPMLFEKLSVPVFLGSYTHREYLNVEYEYTLEQATELLNQKINTFIRTLEEKGVQIIEKNVKIDTNGGKWILSGEFLVRELVGKAEEIVKEELPEINTEVGENNTQ